MKPIIYYFALLPTLAACSNDDVLTSSADTENNEIRVDVVTNSVSRAAELHSSTVNNHMPFDVWSYSYNGSYSVYFKQQPVEWDAIDSKWYFTNGTLYWPHSNASTLKFYAFHGAPDGASVYQNGSNLPIYLKNVKITDPFKQDDLLFASYGPVSPNGGTVSLAFKHLLSQVCVTFTNQTKSVAVEAQKIELFNDTPLKNSGSYQLEWDSSAATLELDNTSDDTSLTVQNADTDYPVAVCPAMTDDFSGETALDSIYTALVLPQSVSDSKAVLYFKLYNLVDPAAFAAKSATITDAKDRHDLLVGQYEESTDTGGSTSTDGGSTDNDIDTGLGSGSNENTSTEDQTGSSGKTYPDYSKYGTLIYSGDGGGYATVEVDLSGFDMEAGKKYVINFTLAEQNVESLGFSPINIYATVYSVYTEQSDVEPDTDSYKKE
jgi:hypothetical protein